MSADASMPPTLAAVYGYHTASTHRLAAYAPGPGYLDWATQPDPFRRFHAAPRVDLPLLADRLLTSFAEVRAGDAISAHAVDRDSVASLLELSLGLSAWKQYGGNRWALRCNPSSGNLHPTEGYVVCPHVPGLTAGVYHYCSIDHALERRAAIDEPRWDAQFNGGFFIGLTSIHWREAWKYGLRAYRYCNHDVGHAIAALRYAAAALGWRAVLVDTWGDDDLATLLGIARDDDFPVAEERETPDALLWIGEPSAAPTCEALLPLLQQATWRGTANRLSSGHRYWEEIDDVAAAAHKPHTMPVAMPALPVRPALMPSPYQASASALIRQRRSAVSFDRATTLSKQAFFTMMDALLPRAAVPPWDALAWMPCVHPLLFVHRVDDMQPGIYILLRDDTALAELRAALHPDLLWERVADAPSSPPLYALAYGDTRRLAELVSCHQEIAADSAFAVAMLARFDATLAQGAWGYRRLHWEAGMLGHVLYLEAEAAAVRGTGIGCFFDDELHDRLGIDGTAFRTLYHFTVGGAVEDTRLATTAGYGHLAGMRENVNAMTRAEQKRR